MTSSTGLASVEPPRRPAPYRMSAPAMESTAGCRVFSEAVWPSGMYESAIIEKVSTGTFHAALQNCAQSRRA